VNLIGPVALENGVVALYDGEHYGRVHTDLDVVIGGEALETFFDPEQTSDELLWRVMGEIADTFDNRYGLPWVDYPMRPAGIEDAPGAEASCEKIRDAFGAHYCSSVVHELERHDAMSRRLNIVNDEDDSASASPSFESGAPVDLELLETLVPSGFLNN